MTMEEQLQQLIVNRCPRSFQTVAPLGQTLPDRPYVVWQHIGGKTLRGLTGDALDHRNSLIQIAAWADSSGAARALIEDIEDDLCTSPDFAVEPQGEHLAQFDADTKLYGAVQRFSIYAPRS